MNREDISIIRDMLNARQHKKLADLLYNGQGEVDVSNFLSNVNNACIAQYLVFLPLHNFEIAKRLTGKEKEEILECITDLFPPGSDGLDIQNVDFRILRSPKRQELIPVDERHIVNYDFAKEQIRKCEEKIGNEDYDGAITSAGSLLEAVFDDIHKRCLGEGIGSTSDLRTAYKKIKSLLKLSDEQYSNESVKAIMVGLSGVIGGIDTVRNQMGDRHKIQTKPWRRHAKLCVNSVRVLVDFLYETLESHQERLDYFYKRLIEILDSNKRLFSRENLLIDEEVLKYLSYLDSFLNRLLIDKIILDFEVNRYRDSDIFFAALKIFLDSLTSDDVEKILDKHCHNSQACGLQDFIVLVKRERSELVSGPNAKKWLAIWEKEKAVSTIIAEENEVNEEYEAVKDVLV